MPPSITGGDSTSTAGLPHSDICGSPVTCTLPQLFAAYRVLLRLIWPRHPPYALSFLTFLLRFFSFFQRSFLRFHVVVKVRGCLNQRFNKKSGGDEENRTPDPLLARQVLSQLSYTPTYYLTSTREERTVKAITKSASVVRTTYTSFGYTDLPWWA